MLLVTGASGHLGANLIRRLLDEGERVRVLLRHGSDNRAVEGLSVERIYGDLRDRASLDVAVRGCERVYHAAALLSTIEGREVDLFESNVLGTRNLLAAARAAKVGRVVVTGSFSAVGHRENGQPSDESDPFNPFDRAMPYEKSKAGVEHECLKAVVEGQDVVVATSCAIIGPNDFKPSRMGAVIRDFANGKLAAYIPGGFEFVAARDIVDGHLLAMSKGRTGQKYIFSTKFVTIDDFMGYCEEVTGRRRPRLRLPPPVMAGVAEVTQFVFSRLRPSAQQRLTPGAVRILRMHRHADISKARDELGYRPSSIRQAIGEAYDWFAAQGQLKMSSGKTPTIQMGATT